MTDDSRSAEGAAGERPPPIGFWSYSRQDDELSGGMLSRLRALVRSELQQQYGRERIQLFQDVSAIPHGAQWEREIRGALGNATFFIPIVTPNFVQSEWCAQEVAIFLERERQLGQGRIFPLHLIDIDGIPPFDPAVVQALEARQWFDFRAFRHRRTEEPEVREALADFARSIRRVLQDEHTARPAPRPIEAHPAAPAAPGPPAIEPSSAPRLRPIFWIALAGALLALIGVAAVLLWPRPRAPEPAQPAQGPAAAPESLATAAGPGTTVPAANYQWLIGGWGYGNCSLIVRIDAGPAGLTVTTGASRGDPERVVHADSGAVETASYRFARDADGLGWYSGSNLITRLVPCPNGEETPQ